MFIDQARVDIEAGRGGDGLVAFRREKYIPRGGPAGGDGGRGGDVILEATTNIHTLSDFRHQRRLRAEDGRIGGINSMSGRAGQDLVVRVPVGTIVRDARTGEQVADMTEAGQRVILAKGGKGGLGNIHFATPANRAPRKATSGKPGQSYQLHLELKLIADVGLVGFPSVGKSTIIAAISGARPKIADYPFTTLVPNLGVVTWKGYREFVIADIPGLIEGAHLGHGLGVQFLKHIERTNLIVHVLEVTPQLEDQPSDRDPIRDFHVICKELARFNPELTERPQMVVLNKCDLPFVREREEELRQYFEQTIGLPFMTISAAGDENMEAFVDRLGEAVFRGTFAPQKEHWES